MAVLENDVLVGPVTPAAGVTTISLDFDGTGWKAAWLEVYKTGFETPLVLGTDYTVSGAGTVSAVVTLTNPANGTDAYSVYLATPLERSSDMQLRGEFKSEPFNIEMDRLWQRLQFHWTHITRSLRLSATSAMDTILSAVSPGQLVQMKADGTGFVGYDPEITVSQVDAWYHTRGSAQAAAAAALADGSIVAIAGLPYLVDSSATGTASATNDLGVDGLKADVQRGFVDLRQFGITGSGDETAKVISAIDSGENLWVPKGMTINATGNLTGFANGQKVHGMGVIKKLGTDQIPVLLLDDELDGVEFRGFTIDGTAANFAGGNPVPGILGYVASNIKCHNMLFTDIADAGIKLRDCANLDAVGNRFLRCYQNGIELRNYAADVRTSVTSVVSGTEYEITSVSGGTDWSGVGGGNPAAVGDVFTATASGSIASLGAARQQYTSDRPAMQGSHRILQNRFKYVGYKEDAASGLVDGCCVLYQSADLLRPLEDILIEGNVGYDILRGFWAESNVLGKESRQIIIRNNMLRNNVDGKTSAFVEDLGYGKVGIGAIGIQNATISGNVIKDIGNYLHTGSDTGGIVVSSNGNKNILIEGNHVIETTTDTDRTDYCIDIRTGGEGIIVRDNSVGGAAQGQINVVSGINGVSVYNNPGAELDYSWPAALHQMAFERENVPANGTQSSYITGLPFNESENQAPFDAQAVGLRVILSTPITAGTAQFQLFLNGSEFGSLRLTESDFSGGTRAYKSIRYGSGGAGQVIRKGERVKVNIVTDASFAPTTLDAWVEVVFAKGA